MDKFLLKHDFVLFEQDYFSCDLSENNFYDLLDDLDLNQFITDLFQKKYLNNSSLDRIFKKNMHDLSQFFLKDCINFEKFIYFKSEADILHAYLFLFLIKTLSFKTKSFRTKEGVETSFSVRDYFLDRNDFINIFVDYLYKFFIFNEILHKKFFNLNKGFLRSFTFRFVEFCNIIGLISLKDLKTSNRHFKLVIFNSCRISFIPEVSFFLKKYDVYIRFNSDPYIYNNHFTSVVSITKQATYSNATFKIQSDQVNALTQRSFFIDRSLLTNNYKILLQSFSLSEQTDLSFLVEDFSLKILKFLNEGDLNGVRSYHSKLSSVLTLIRIKTILSMNFDNKKLHLPFMFCFRGRVYELSNLSFTFYKEFRFCLYSGIYDIEDELFHPINSQINTTLENYFYFFKKYDWFLSLNLIRKRACV
jgi:hypothetical protein